MSYSKKIYVGVYLECKNRLVPKIIKVKRCQDSCTEETYDWDLNFCPICGQELRERDIEQGLKQSLSVEIPSNLEDVMCDINIFNFPRNKTLYRTNLNIGQLNISQINPNETESIQEYEIDSLDNDSIFDPTKKSPISKCFEEFVNCKEYELFLKFCEEAYGKENVKIKFGTLVYYI